MKLGYELTVFPPDAFGRPRVRLDITLGSSWTYRVLDMAEPPRGWRPGYVWALRSELDTEPPTEPPK